MVKWHFIYSDIGTGYFPSVHHGIAQLVAVLRKNGYDASLHHIREEIKESQLVVRIAEEHPDVVGFTTMSNQIEYVKLWSRWIKDYCHFMPIICGGVHATLNPDEVIAYEGVDAVCVGDGEQVMSNCGYWLEHKNLGVGIWNKSGGMIAKGKPFPVIENLDELPFPDYSLFDIEGMLKTRNGKFAVIASRGCPYDCSYCSNSALRKRLKGLGKYFRYRSVDNTIEMLKHYVGLYPIKSFTFADDIFGLSKKWVFEFCKKYPKSIGLPFDCNLRVEAVTEEILEVLKSANCDMIEVGIESGNRRLRTEVLNRKMTNQQIVDAFELAHKFGIKTRAYNMVGLPYETLEMARQTLELNKRVKPDEVAVFYFYPYKGTKLYDVCESEGLIADSKTTGYVSKSVLKLPDFSAKELESIHDDFYRYMMDRMLQSYRQPLRCTFRAIAGLLRWITLGNEIKGLELAYSKCRPILQRLGGN